MQDVSLIVYTAADMAKAKQFFRELLGAEPYADSPYYVGYRSGEMEVGLVPQGTNAGPGALAYWTVDDVTDVAQGLLVASVKDPNGAIVGLRQFPRANATGSACPEGPSAVY